MFGSNIGISSQDLARLLRTGSNSAKYSPAIEDENSEINIQANSSGDNEPQDYNFLEFSTLLNMINFDAAFEKQNVASDLLKDAIVAHFMPHATINAAAVFDWINIADIYMESEQADSDQLGRMEKLKLAVLAVILSAAKNLSVYELQVLNALITSCKDLSLLDLVNSNTADPNIKVYATTTVLLQHQLEPNAANDHIMALDYTEKQLESLDKLRPVEILSLYHTLLVLAVRERYKVTSVVAYQTTRSYLKQITNFLVQNNNPQILLDASIPTSVLQLAIPEILSNYFRNYFVSIGSELYPNINTGNATHETYIKALLGFTRTAEILQQIDIAQVLKLLEMLKNAPELQQQLLRSMENFTPQRKDLLFASVNVTDSLLTQRALDHFAKRLTEDATDRVRALYYLHLLLSVASKILRDSSDQMNVARVNHILSELESLDKNYNILELLMNEPTIADILVAYDIYVLFTISLPGWNITQKFSVAFWERHSLDEIKLQMSNLTYEMKAQIMQAALHDYTSRKNSDVIGTFLEYIDYKSEDAAIFKPYLEYAIFNKSTVLITLLLQKYGYAVIPARWAFDVTDATTTEQNGNVLVHDEGLAAFKKFLLSVALHLYNPTQELQEYFDSHLIDMPDNVTRGNIYFRWTRLFEAAYTIFSTAQDDVAVELISKFHDLLVDRLLEKLNPKSHGKIVKNCVCQIIMVRDPEGHHFAKALQKWPFYETSDVSYILLHSTNPCYAPLIFQYLNEWLESNKDLTKQTFYKILNILGIMYAVRNKTNPPQGDAIISGIEGLLRNIENVSKKDLSTLLFTGYADLQGSKIKRDIKRIVSMIIKTAILYGNTKALFWNIITNQQFHNFIKALSMQELLSEVLNHEVRINNEIYFGIFSLKTPLTLDDSIYALISAVPNRHLWLLNATLDNLPPLDIEDVKKLLFNLDAAISEAANRIPEGDRATGDIENRLLQREIIYRVCKKYYSGIGPEPLSMQDARYLSTLLSEFVSSSQEAIELYPELTQRLNSDTRLEIMFDPNDWTLSKIEYSLAYCAANIGTLPSLDENTKAIWLLKNLFIYSLLVSPNVFEGLDASQAHSYADEATQTMIQILNGASGSLFEEIFNNPSLLYKIDRRYLINALFVTIVYLYKPDNFLDPAIFGTINTKEAIAVLLQDDYNATKTMRKFKEDLRSGIINLALTNVTVFSGLINDLMQNFKPNYGTLKYKLMQYFEQFPGIAQFCLSQPDFLLKLSADDIDAALQNNFGINFALSVREFFYFPTSMQSLEQFNAALHQDLRTQSIAIHIGKLIYIRELKKANPELDENALLSADQDDAQIKREVTRIRDYFISGQMQHSDAETTAILEQAAPKFADCIMLLRSKILATIVRLHPNSSFAIFIADHHESLIRGELAQEALAQFTDNADPFPAWRWLYNFVNDIATQNIETDLFTLEQASNIDYQEGSHYQHRLIIDLMRLFYLAINDIQSLTNQPGLQSLAARASKQEDMQTFLIATLSYLRREYSKGDGRDEQSCLNGTIGRLFLLFKSHPIIGVNQHDEVREKTNMLLDRVFSEALNEVLDSSLPSDAKIPKLHAIFTALGCLSTESAQEFLSTGQIVAWTQDLSEYDIHKKLLLRNEILRKAFPDPMVLYDKILSLLQASQPNVILSTVDVQYILYSYYAVATGDAALTRLHEIYIAVKESFNSSEEMLLKNLTNRLHDVQQINLSAENIRLLRRKFTHSLQNYVKNKIKSAKILDANEELLKQILVQIPTDAKIARLSVASIQRLVAFEIREYSRNAATVGQSAIKPAP